MVEQIRIEINISGLLLDYNWKFGIDIILYLADDFINFCMYLWDLNRVSLLHLNLVISFAKFLKKEIGIIYQDDYSHEQFDD